MKHAPQNYPPPPYPGDEAGHTQDQAPIVTTPLAPSAMDTQNSTQYTHLMGLPIYGPLPLIIQCPHCRNNVTTRLTYQAGLLTWLVAAVICLFGGIFGCCLIPFCLEFCLDVVHSCPVCNVTLGVHKRLS